MENFHRKILYKSTEISVVIRKPPSADDHPPLQPSRPLTPQPKSSNHTLSSFLFFIFCVLAFSFLLICYLIFVKRYQSRRRLRIRNHHEINIANHQDFVNEDLGPVIDHPVWLINTVGLDQSQIESIHIFKYKKDESLIEGTDCSVCLSEFEDDESLRLLPKCNHAFHVPCIDTWLRSHKNCPLCRAPIIKNTNDQTESNTSEETETPVVVVSETIDDNDVVEVENNNNGEIEKKFGSVEDETRVRVHSDLADHHRVQSEEVLAMRRSFSNSQLLVSKKLSNYMPKQKAKESTSSNIHMCVMKSSSFGHSSRKSSSFTTKCAHNRSY